MKKCYSLAWVLNTKEATDLDLLFPKMTNSFKTPFVSRASISLEKWTIFCEFLAKRESKSFLFSHVDCKDTLALGAIYLVMHIFGP